MKRIFELLFPERRCVITVSCDCVGELLDFGVKSGEYLRVYEKCGNTVIEISEREECEICKLLSAMGYEYEKKQSSLHGYKRRLGLYIGAFIFVLITWYFSNILWSVDVVGNKEISAVEIKEILSECGVREGMFIKNIDNDKVRVSVLERSKDIAWISVNVKGMRAEVVVAEAARAPEKEDSNGYAHIVASCDGMITGIVVERGKPMVAIGDTVKKGEMLVSGIIEERDGDISLVKAKARVYAQTERVIEVFQPYEAVNKSLKGEKLCEIYFNLFGKSLKFSGIYGLDASECDIIGKRGSVSLFRGFDLPVSYHARYALVTEDSSVSLSDIDARKLAEDEAYRKLFSEADAEIVSKRLVFESSDDGVKLTLFAVCEENISNELPFMAEP